MECEVEHWEWEVAYPSATELQRLEMVSAMNYLNDPVNRPEIDHHLGLARQYNDRLAMIYELPFPPDDVVRPDGRAARSAFGPRKEFHALTGARLGQLAVELTDLPGQRVKGKRSAARLIVNAPRAQDKEFFDVFHTNSHDYDTAPGPLSITLPPRRRVKSSV